MNKNQVKEQYRLDCCILKGKTTSLRQFKRFVKSFYKALVESENSKVLVSPYWYLDDAECVKVVKAKFKNPHILVRSADAGDVRNEFLGLISTLKLEPTNFFTFFDGDDEIRTDYFAMNLEELKNSPSNFAICNPVAVYGPEETDYYPLKWCLTASKPNIKDLAFEDRLGGQSWGKIYKQEVVRYAMFDTGMYEDVGFWYDVVEHLPENCSPVKFWNSVYFWHRDNPNAITRSVGTLSYLQDGLQNLEKARLRALKICKNTDPRVWRRYTFGIASLLRNAAKITDVNERKISLKYITDNLDLGSLNFRDAMYQAPALYDRLIESFPEFDAWKKELMRIRGF